jgi:hypothetical protein
MLSEDPLAFGHQGGGQVVGVEGRVVGDRKTYQDNTVPWSERLGLPLRPPPPTNLLTPGPQGRVSVPPFPLIAVLLSESTFSG